MRMYLPTRLAATTLITWSLACLLTACNFGSDDNAVDGEFQGYYLQEFEVSSFVPCGSWRDPGYGVGYWLDWRKGQYQRYEEEVSNAGADRKVYLRFKGHLSSVGSYGHLGKYSRQVTVGEVIEISRNGKCH